MRALRNACREGEGDSEVQQDSGNKQDRIGLQTIHYPFNTMYDAMFVGYVSPVGPYCELWIKHVKFKHVIDLLFYILPTASHLLDVFVLLV